MILCNISLAKVCGSCESLICECNIMVFVWLMNIVYPSFFFVFLINVMVFNF